MMKVFLLKRKLLTVLACALAAAAIFCAVHYPAAVSAAAALALGTASAALGGRVDSAISWLIYCVQRDQKMVAISFDAAWGDVILRTLGRKGSGAPTPAFLCQTAARVFAVIQERVPTGRSHSPPEHSLLSCLQLCRTPSRNNDRPPG